MYLSSAIPIDAFDAESAAVGTDVVLVHEACMAGHALVRAVLGREPSLERAGDAHLYHPLRAYCYGVEP